MTDDLMSDDNDQDGDHDLPPELEDREPDTDTPPDEVDQSGTGCTSAPAWATS